MTEEDKITLRAKVAIGISVMICAKCGKVGEYCDNCPLIKNQFEYEIADVIIPIIQQAERERIIRGVGKELYQLYKQFDKNFKPTEDESKVYERLYLISQSRIDKMWQALREGKG